MSDTSSSGSVERVRRALADCGIHTISTIPAGTKTAADAARSLGCDVSDIGKSIVLIGEDRRPVVIVLTGELRVDMERVSEYLGMRVKRAEPNFVRETTGFAIGGVSPMGLNDGCRVLLDQSLWRRHFLWLAAGSPNSVFSCTAEELLRATNGERVKVST